MRRRADTKVPSELRFRAARGRTSESLADLERSQRTAGGKKAERRHHPRSYPGSVKSRAVHPGEYLKVQSPVMVLVRTDRLRARLAVPERWAGWVKDGALVDLHVEAFPAEMFQGTMTRINPAVSQDSRTFEAEAMIENQEQSPEARIFCAGIHPQRKRRENDLRSGAGRELSLRRVQSFPGEWRSRLRAPDPSGRADRRRTRTAIRSCGRTQAWRPRGRSSTGELHDGDKVQEQADTSTSCSSVGSPSSASLAMKLAEICVRHPVFTVMLIAFLVTLGVFSYRGLAVDLFPKADPATVNVGSRCRARLPTRWSLASCFRSRTRSLRSAALMRSAFTPPKAG